MAENKVEKYENPISVTAQFRFCGNPLRADMYRNCSFQCNYCFAKTHISHYDDEKDELNGYGWIEKADKCIKKLDTHPNKFVWRIFKNGKEVESI